MKKRILLLTLHCYSHFLGGVNMNLACFKPMLSVSSFESASDLSSKGCMNLACFKSISGAAEFDYSGFKRDRSKSEKKKSSDPQKQLIEAGKQLAEIGKLLTEVNARCGKIVQILETVN